MPRLGRLEIEGCCLAGQVRVLVCRDVDRDVVGFVHDDQPRIADDGAIGQHLVGVQFQGAVQVGAQVDGELGSPLLHRGRAGGQGLPGLDDVQVDAAKLDGCEGYQVHRLADDVGGAVGAEEHAVALFVGLKIHFPPGCETGLVLGNDLDPVGPASHRRKGELGQAVLAGGELHRIPAVDADLESRRRGPSVRVGGEYIDHVLYLWLEHPALGHGLDDQGLLGDGQHLARLLGVVGLIDDRDL